jgi:type VII secretion integral membrane protein EccD
MSASDPDMRRVCVHADGADVDLVLPPALPVATLIPAIVGMLGGTAVTGASYRLSPLGRAPLLNSTTLAQNGIGDGAVLVLSQETQERPTPRCGDQALAVSEALDNSTQSRPSTRVTGAVAAVCLTAVGCLALVRDAFSLIRHGDATAAVTGAAGITALVSAAIAHRVYRDPIAGLALSVIATTFAAVAGLLAVPGVPGAPHLLLAGMAAAATAVLAIRVTHCGAVTLSAVACSAVVAASAALAGMITAAPPHVLGSSTALVCLGLLEVAPRMSIVAARLSPRLDPDHAAALQTGGALASSAFRADHWLTSLRGGLAASAGTGATVAALAAPRAIALAAVIGGLLLLHARMDRRRTLMFATTGIGTIATVFAIAATSLPKHGPGIVGLTAVLVAAAMYLGFVAPAISLSPPARRGVAALGCLALTAVVPLACWTCGAFGAVGAFRGLNLGRM